MKKLFTLIVAICATTLAWADDSGSCGENVTYSFVESTGTLTISGTGDMTSRPWSSYYSSIKTVVIESGVTSIGSLAFYDCTELTSITIPNSVTSIGDAAFYDCTGLTSITIPNGVTSIGEWAFCGCTGLTSITIGNGVTSIGGSAFVGCIGLTSITIPNSVTSIGDWAFGSCTGLTSITIGNGVTSIGSLAFYDCTELTSITIPNSVTSIRGGAFGICTGLTSMTVKATNPPLCVDDYGDGLAMPNYNIPLYVPAGSVDAYKAADEWKKFTNIQAIPATGVNEATAEKADDSGSCGENVTYSFVESTGTLTISGTGDMYVYAVSYDRPWYDYYSSIKKVVIESGVTSIGNKAFYGCTGLTSITIPNSLTSIGDAAFYGCTGLTSVTIGNGVTTIGEYAFYGCKGLTSMTVEATNPPSYSSTYNMVPNYNIPLYVPAGSVDAYKAADEWKKFTNIQAIPSTGVNEAAAEKSEVKKIIDRNGIIYIEKDGTRYFLNGGKAE